MAQPLPDVDPAWSHLPLIDSHIDILVKAAITPVVAERMELRSLTTLDELAEYAPEISTRESLLGLLIPWRATDGRIVPQIKLDVPLRDDNGKIVAKYMSPRSEVVGPQPFGIVRTAPEGAEDPILLYVEGAKQAMAMASCLPPDMPIDIWAMQGCYGWTHADTYLSVGRRVVIAPDADYSTNLDVYRAIKQFGESLETIGASQVRFLKVPATGKDGVDDWLGRLPASARATAAENLVDRAVTSMGRPPAARRRLASVPTGPTTGFFDATGKFLPQDAADAYAEEFPVAKMVGDDNPWCYSPSGVYVSGLDIPLNTFCVRLGNDYMVGYKNALCDKLSAMADLGTRLPYFLTEPLLNCKNGVVNLDTLEFTEHSPELPCTIQIPYDYLPDATCPVFDEFMARHAGEQTASLMEHCSTMLDHTKAPERAVMMYGEGGTGKSTFMKFITKIAGPYASHQSLHSVSEDKFSQAQLHNKILNTCGDLSNKDINDPSQFKQVTGGGDPIEAQKKYGKHVKFEPRALMIFSMNQVPRVSENSDAYFRRVAPYRFNTKYPIPGTQVINEYVEQNEMEGILAQLVRAAHNMRRRGYALKPSPEVEKDYQAKVCRVRGWFNEWAEITEDIKDGLPSQELYAHFLQKSEAGAEKPMALQSFSTRLKNVTGVVDGRPYIMGKQVRCFNVRIKDRPTDPDSGPDNPPPPAPDPVPPTPPKETVDLPPVTLDLETGSVDEMFANRDPEFIRLVGVMDGERGEEVQIFTDYEKGMITGSIVGQNVIAYDLAVLHHRGLFDLEQVISGEVEVYDTMLAARLSDPPPARQSPAQERGRYSLAGLAARFELPIEKDVLPRLAKEYGGWDKIPQDNEEYREYLRKDVVTTAKVKEKLGPLDDYGKREMRVAAIAAQMSSTGIRIDVPLLEERLEAGRVKKEAAIQRLHKEYGLPLEGKSPHASKEGKAALKKAFKDAGATAEDATFTDSGEISFGKDAMDKILERHTEGDLHELATVVKELNGIRTVYGTVHDFLIGDRVHPHVDMRQASGRWSITKPGLTVIGKRGFNLSEREMFLPEEGHVFLSCDLAQVDARCVAALSECDGYRQMFRPGVDLHTEVAEAIFGDADKRQLAKVVSHGWNYGASPGGIAWATGVSEEVAQEYDRQATQRFPGVVRWRETVSTLAKQGILLDNGWGRKLLGDPQRSRTQAPGLVGQSAARDIATEALLRMRPEVRRCLRLWIHDELLLSVPEDQYEEYKAEVLEAMNFEWKGIQFMGDSGVPGKTWRGAYGK